MTSRQLVPMEPVDPSTTTRRRPLEVPEAEAITNHREETRTSATERRRVAQRWKPASSPVIVAVSIKSPQVYLRMGRVPVPRSDGSLYSSDALERPWRAGRANGWASGACQRLGEPGVSTPGLEICYRGFHTPLSPGHDAPARRSLAAIPSIPGRVI